MLLKNYNTGILGNMIHTILMHNSCILCPLIWSDIRVNSTIIVWNFFFIIILLTWYFWVFTVLYTDCHKLISGQRVHPFLMGNLEKDECICGHKLFVYFSWLSWISTYFFNSTIVLLVCIYHVLYPDHHLQMNILNVNLNCMSSETDVRTPRFPNLFNKSLITHTSFQDSLELFFKQQL